MADDKISISRDELYTPEVEARLKKQEALARAVEHSQQHDEPDQPPPPVKPRRGPLWYNPILYTALFGLVGGLVAWGVGEMIMRIEDSSPIQKDFREADIVFLEEKRIGREEDKIFKKFNHRNPNDPQLRESLEKVYQAHSKTPLGQAILEEFQLKQRFLRGELNHFQVQQAMDSLKAKLQQAFEKNCVLKIEFNRALKNEEKDQLIKALMAKERPRILIGEIAFQGQLGLWLACFLALADSVVGCNWRGAVVNGSVGMLLGLLGGLLVALFINELYHFLGGGRLDPRLAEQMLARAAAWGVLGLFLAIAPGLVLRSRKRLAIGLAGGLVGGLIGGLAFDPLGLWLDSGVPARGVGLATIGLLTGVATGLIEQAAKRGWLHVTEGLIAGKQFILYRNPTVIGSSPRCEIYLFKDPDVSPRHAAIHRVRGGFELEDLGSATGTRVNGRPVKRARLRNGDQVQVGATAFVFREKARTAVDDQRPARSEAPRERAVEEVRPGLQGSDQIWEKKCI
jgi:hypothetical protein